VDFDLTPAQEAFREEIREFLRSELAAAPGRVREDGWVVGFSRAFLEKLGKRAAASRAPCSTRPPPRSRVGRAIS